jgi:hypothetical protein
MSRLTLNVLPSIAQFRRVFGVPPVSDGMDCRRAADSRRLLMLGIEVAESTVGS